MMYPTVKTQLEVAEKEIKAARLYETSESQLFHIKVAIAALKTASEALK